MNAHHRFQEWQALRLYDELVPAEAELLEAHLSSCEECRRFGAELERGLGGLPREPHFDLPADWEERLRQEAALVEAERPAGRLWWTAAASFAAGVLVTLIFTLLRTEAPETASGLPAIPSISGFAQEMPPAPATTRGLFATLRAGRRS